MSVVSQLPKLLQDNHDECIRRVVPKIRELLPVSHTEMQVEATDVFRRILEEDDVPSLMYAQTFLPTILNLMESRDPDIGEMWLETLLDVMELLSKETIRRDVLPRAISKGQMTQSVASRLVSCRMLSRIATCLDSIVTQKELLPVVQALCQDVEYEVRACMCRQLHVIARVICLESIKLVILPELVELVNDEHASVRLAGLEALVSIVPLLDEGLRSTVVIPLAVKLCQQAQTDDSTLLSSVSKYLGALLLGVSGSLSASQKEWFFEFYRKLCCNGLPESSGSALQQQQRSKADVNDNVPQAKPTSSGLEFDRIGKDSVAECRANAAANFPAVLGLYLGVPLLEARLCESFSRLCKDPSPAVRQRAAHGFHEVARTLTAHLSLLARDLVCLLRDDCHEVLQGLIYGMSVTLETFGTAASSGQPGESKHFVMPPDFLSAILACDASISSSNDWRLQETFLLELSALTKCCGSDGLYQRIVPMLFHKLATSARAIPVRRAAVRTLLLLLRSNRKLEQRNEMCRKIITEFGKSSSFRHRMLFIDVCIVVLDVYSHRFFTTTFHEHLMRLADDAVPNVRLRAYSLLPRIGHAARLLSDAVTANEIADLAVRRLTAESDRDAVDSLRAACNRIGLPCGESKLQTAASTCKVGSTVAYAGSTESATAESEERRRTSEEQALLSEEEKDEEARKKAEKKSQRIASSKFVLDPKEKVKRASTSKIPMSPHLASNRIEQQKTVGSGAVLSQVPSPTSYDGAVGIVKRVNTPHNGSAAQTASPRATRRDPAAMTVVTPVSKATRTSMLPTAKRAGSGTAVPSMAASAGTVGSAAQGSPTSEPVVNGSLNGRSDLSLQQRSLHNSPSLSKRPTTVGATGRSQSVRTPRKD